MSQEISAKPDSTAKPYPEAESSSEQVGKVAEGVATYAYTPLKKTASVPPQIAGILISEEVWRFAVANEIVSHLETAVRLVRESFRKVIDVRFTHDIDQEIENDSWITLRAKVQGSLEDLVREHWAYMEAIVRAVPINKLPFISLSPEVI
jgi:hypothetical protein